MALTGWRSLISRPGPGEESRRPVQVGSFDFLQINSPDWHTQSALVASADLAG